MYGGFGETHRSRRGGVAALRKALRPTTVLGVDDITETTKQRYETQVSAFERFLLSQAGGGQNEPGLASIGGT